VRGKESNSLEDVEFGMIHSAQEVNTGRSYAKNRERLAAIRGRVRLDRGAVHAYVDFWFWDDSWFPSSPDVDSPCV
jgi:hypothetical protein